LKRERSRTQALETKANAAECEVNDLTSKYEDIVEQFKTTEMQLEETEKKFDVERAHSAKEKQQWLQILKHADDLSKKAKAERDQLAKERAHLSQQVSCLEVDKAQRESQTSTGECSQEQSSTQQSALPESTSINRTASPVTSGLQLQEDIAVYRQRIHALRSALIEARRRNERLVHDTHALVEQHEDWNNDISALLKADDGSQSHTRSLTGSRTQSAPESMSLSTSHSRVSTVHKVLNTSSLPQDALPGTSNTIASLSSSEAAPGTFSENTPEAVGLSPAPSTKVRPPFSAVRVNDCADFRTDFKKHPNTWCRKSSASSSMRADCGKSVEGRTEDPGRG
jgi:chromosome segregation ATPase